MEAGNHGASGASAQRHAAPERGGGSAYALILEAVNIALVILSRLRLARQLVVKVCSTF